MTQSSAHCKSVLAQNRYFHGLPDALIEKIAAVCTWRPASAGEVIITAGSAGDCMFIVAEGSVEVYLEDATTGTERLLSRMGAGSGFGELSVITGLPRTANVRAVDSLLLIALTSTDFRALMSKLPRLAVNVCRTLGEWLYKTNSQVGYQFVRLSNHPIEPAVTTRLSRRLVEFYKAIPLSQEGNRVVVAMTDPTDLLAIDSLRKELNDTPIEAVIVSETDFTNFCERSLAALYNKNDPWHG